MILFLKPYFSKKPWAGNKLNKIYDCDEDTGEAWVVSGFKNKSSVILNGEYKGKTLRWLWSNKPILFGNMIDKEFPLLIKLISSKEKLSVQVHPNDDYAIKRHNQLGKSECWYIVHGNEAKTAAVGMKVKNQIELKSAIEGNMLENFLIQEPIKENDLVVVDPGTVHAMNENSLVLEIQESSDVTYRLYDYNREPKRELHIEDALNVIDYSEKNRIVDFDKENVYSNNYFKISRKKIKNISKFEISGFSIFYVLNGEGSYDKYSFKTGNVFVVTNDTKAINIKGNVDILEIIPIPNKRDRFAKKIPVAFITGALNQDGFYLTKLLLEKGYKVYAQYFEKTKYDNSCVKEFESNKFFNAIQCDMKDTNQIYDIISEIKPDEIYHLSGQMQISKSFDDPELTTELNSLATIRLLESIKNSEVRTKMFNLQTPYLFTGIDYPQTENTKMDPKSPFAVSKHFSYEIAKSYRENFGLNVINGICYNHESKYKNGEFVAKKICTAANKIASGEENMLLLGNLNAMREFGHAEDYARAIWQSLQNGGGDDYIIATGNALTIREFATLVFKKKNIELVWHGEGIDEVGIDKKTKKVIVTVDPLLLRPNDSEILVGDATHFKNKFNFEFKHDINSLIDELLEATK